MEVIRTERGWAGHFICSNRCQFRRNTLLECENIKIVVSTVGLVTGFKDKSKYAKIGMDHYYETKAFHAQEQDGYYDIDVSQEIYFDSNCQINDIYVESDLDANDMHEIVVAEITKKLENGEQFEVEVLD